MSVKKIQCDERLYSFLNKLGKQGKSVTHISVQRAVINELYEDCLQMLYDQYHHSNIKAMLQGELRNEFEELCTYYKLEKSEAYSKEWKLLDDG